MITKRKGQESNLPQPGSPAAYGFEDRGGHQTPSASAIIITGFDNSGKLKYISIISITLHILFN